MSFVLTKHYGRKRKTVVKRLIHEKTLENSTSLRLKKKSAETKS